MPDYKAAEAPATIWQRCYQVELANPLNGERSCTFREEVIMAAAAATFNRGAGACTIVFDPAGQFPLLDMATGEPTGQTMTHAALYAALHSLYLYTAGERDRQIAEQDEQRARAIERQAAVDQAGKEAEEAHKRFLALQQGAAE